MGRLENKVALITGAGTGIGRGCMVMFAKEGATVCGVSRTQKNLDETLRLVEDAGGKGSVFSADLSTPEGAEAAVNECIRQHGRIDILLNAAGVGYNWRETSLGSMDPVHTTPIDKWHEVMALNLHSLFYVSRLVLRQMIAQNKGSIVNVASIFGMGGAPDAHTYTATKGAIINLTKSMAVAYVDNNIRCNVVAPGFVQTQMVESVLPMLFSAENPKLIAPMGRPATVDEVGYACLYFASDEASYCTGTVLAVDGGSTGRA
jgi:NAD(P)-dependent dehydrogenase (short-subunit alcohol dehydrogenase family)